MDTATPLCIHVPLLVVHKRQSFVSVVKTRGHMKLNNGKNSSVYSQLPLNGHLSKTDTCSWSLPFLQSHPTLFKTDTSIKRTMDTFQADLGVKYLSKWTLISNKDSGNEIKITVHQRKQACLITGHIFDSSTNKCVCRN